MTAWRRAMAPCCAALLLAACGSPDRPWHPLPEVMHCDAARTVCATGKDGEQVRLQLGPGVKGLHPFPIILEVPDAESVVIRFEMPGMDMGKIVHRLRETATNRWEGRAVLPICLSGRSDWVAKAEIVHRDGRRVLAVFPFRVGS